MAISDELRKQVDPNNESCCKHCLSNKCKEWSYTQGYILFSKIRLNSSLASCYFDTMGKHDYEDGYHNDFRAESEPEAIFKACQWILTKDSE